MSFKRCTGRDHLSNERFWFSLPRQPAKPPRLPRSRSSRFGRRAAAPPCCGLSTADFRTKAETLRRPRAVKPLGRERLGVGTRFSRNFRKED